MTWIPRLHLFEFEDQQWLPGAIRHGITDFLQFLGNVSADPYREFTRDLVSAMRATGTERIVDLCSGSGGPFRTLLPLLVEASGHDVSVQLTDLYPRADGQRMDGRVAYSEEPVDATDVPSTLDGFRTMFNGFHHFEPRAARSILADSIAKGQGLAVFEGIERTVVSIAVCTLSVLTVPLVTPFIRPFRWPRLLFTYVVPLIPIMAAWDGVVSSLRCYTADELLALASDADVNGLYEWKSRRVRVPRSPTAMTYLIGWPQEDSAQRPDRRS